MTLREPQSEVGVREWDVDLDISEAGLVSLWYAKISVPDRSFNGITYTGILVDHVAAVVHEFLVAVAAVSAMLRYGSSWDLGLGLTHLWNTRPVVNVATLRSSSVGAFSPAYEAQSLIQTTRAEVIELEKQPGVVAERLLGLFARATSTENFLAPLLSAPWRTATEPTS